MKFTKELLLHDISDKWKNILDNVELNEVITDLNDLDLQEHEFSPHPSKFFEFARLTRFEDIMVVIVGMDPYPNVKNAHGLAFSCLGTKIPGSLNNIYKAIENCGYIIKKPYTGNLSNWAKQGVLLINTALSTENGKSGKHVFIWNNYMDNVIRNISYHDNNIIWLLWGNHAKAYSKSISSSYKLEYGHPSPLASKQPFKDCDHFKQVNHLLQNKIEWDPSIHVNKLTDIPCDCNKFFKCHSRQHIIFTDGGCYPNNKSNASLAGYATLFACGPSKGIKIIGSLRKLEDFPPSNIRAEGMALIKALNHISQPDELEKWDNAIIILDCEFWIDMINTYMPSWSKAHFEEKANRDMTKKIWSLWQNLTQKNIELIHMRSHNKSGWKSYDKGTKERWMYDMNNQVDELATYARLNMKPGTYSL